jgi:5-(aminomethyl)-3-furanmethanol phosphate kinase
MHSWEPQRLAILKLGGSLARGGRLREWLDAIRAQMWFLVVVPGGGPFADVVRCLQGEIGFDDAAAHEMAMVAMSQFGRALQSLRSGFELTASVEDIGAALAAGKTPIWSPERMALAAKLPASWDITSDSLAAWLAGKLRAERLILVKHAPSAGSARALAATGVVDPAFPGYLGASGARAFLAAPDEAHRLGEGLEGKAFAEIAR